MQADRGNTEGEAFVSIKSDDAGNAMEIDQGSEEGELGPSFALFLSPLLPPSLFLSPPFFVLIFATIIR